MALYGKWLVTVVQLSWGKKSEFVILYLSGHNDGRSHRYLYHPRILFNLKANFPHNLAA